MIHQPCPFLYIIQFIFISYSIFDKIARFIRVGSGCETYIYKLNKCCCQIGIRGRYIHLGNKINKIKILHFFEKQMKLICYYFGQI